MYIERAKGNEECVRERKGGKSAEQVTSKNACLRVYMYEREKERTEKYI